MSDRKSTLPEDSQERKGIPFVTGLLDYFPAALAEVARVSKFGNDKHNPGEPLHWSREKSSDHVDCIGRHLVDRGTRDGDGVRHSAQLAWRALALLQEELEAEGAPLARGATLPATFAGIPVKGEPWKGLPDTPPVTLAQALRELEEEEELDGRVFAAMYAPPTKEENVLLPPEEVERRKMATALNDASRYVRDNCTPEHPCEFCRRTMNAPREDVGD